MRLIILSLVFSLLSLVSASGCPFGHDKKPPSPASSYQLPDEGHANDPPTKREYSHHDHEANPGVPDDEKTLLWNVIKNDPASAISLLQSLNQGGGRAGDAEKKEQKSAFVGPRSEKEGLVLDAIMRYYKHKPRAEGSSGFDAPDL